MRDARWRPQRRVLGSPPDLSARAGDVLGGGPAPSLPEAPLSRPDRPGPWRPVGSALEESPRQQRPRSPPFRQDSQNTAEWPRDHLPETPARPEAGRRNKAMMTNAAFLVYFQSHNKPETRNSWVIIGILPSPKTVEHWFLKESETGPQCLLHMP
nr:uncharacterized protein LOC129476912 isoform X2 [Symphalangus syndactylus]